VDYSPTARVGLVAADVVAGARAVGRQSVPPSLRRARHGGPLPGRHPRSPTPPVL